VRERIQVWAALWKKGTSKHLKTQRLNFSTEASQEQLLKRLLFNSLNCIETGII